jgi:hypothetical protein
MQPQTTNPAARGACGARKTDLAGRLIVSDHIAQTSASASIAILDRRGFLLAVVAGPTAARAYLREVRSC